MQLKRYRSASVREALALARQELGPNALVLSTRLVGAPGVRGWLGARVVEVTAAADREMSANRPETLADRHIQPEAEPLGVPPALPEWQAGLVARLCATGLDRALATEVAVGFPRWHRRDLSAGMLRRAIAERLGPVAAGHEGWAGVDVFVGPPGVGKTTTIAKIAAQERVRHGRRLTLIAADGFRVGAVEQLRLYADIIGAPFMTARTPDDLAEALAAARGAVLVDTAGRSPRDPEATRLFEVLAAQGDVRTHLVLPAAMARRDAERAVATFAAAAPARVVLTRVDEAESVAPLIGLLKERALPVSYLGTGQRVPEDLERATPAALAARVLGEGGPPAGGRS
jgi:flagellar biosynthesis protein FlhF